MVFRKLGVSDTTKIYATKKTEFDIFSIRREQNCIGIRLGLQDRCLLYIGKIVGYPSVFKVLPGKKIEIYGLSVSYVQGKCCTSVKNEAFLKSCEIRPDFFLCLRQDVVVVREMTLHEKILSGGGGTGSLMSTRSSTRCQKDHDRFENHPASALLRMSESTSE